MIWGTQKKDAYIEAQLREKIEALPAEARFVRTFFPDSVPVANTAPNLQNATQEDFEPRLITEIVQLTPFELDDGSEVMAGVSQDQQVCYVYYT